MAQAGRLSRGSGKGEGVAGRLKLFATWRSRRSVYRLESSRHGEWEVMKLGGMLYRPWQTAGPAVQSGREVSRLWLYACRAAEDALASRINDQPVTLVDHLVRVAAHRGGQVACGQLNNLASLLQSTLDNAARNGLSDSNARYVGGILWSRAILRAVAALSDLLHLAGGKVAIPAPHLGVLMHLAADALAQPHLLGVLADALADAPENEVVVRCRHSVAVCQDFLAVSLCQNGPHITPDILTGELASVDIQAADALAENEWLQRRQQRARERAAELATEVVGEVAS